ncbi:MAG: hypothetical protein HRO68_00480 [Nitrosopumilus sp.]|nr:hypothetical protein [Nitrosopumilus sp.]
MTFTTIEGEVVCSCGLVVGEDHIYTSSNISKTNLAQDYQLGGKKTGKFINQYSELSMISNICHSLDLPTYVSHDVWKWYHRINGI